MHRLRSAEGQQKQVVFLTFPQILASAKIWHKMRRRSSMNLCRKSSNARRACTSQIAAATISCPVRGRTKS